MLRRKSSLAAGHLPAGSNAAGATRLLAKKGREGVIAELIAAAKADRMFPRKAAPGRVRMHIAAMGGSGEWLALADDAETDWLSY